MLLEWCNQAVQLIRLLEVRQIMASPSICHIKLLPSKHKKCQASLTCV